MAAYDVSEWSDLFVASAGAAAALAGPALGLTIAAVSRASLPGRDEPRAWLIGRVTLLASGTLPFVIGAISLLAETGGGLYWTVAGILFAIGGGVANAWVLLIEILR